MFNFNWLEYLRYFFSCLYFCDRVYKVGYIILFKYRIGIGVNFFKFWYKRIMYKSVINWIVIIGKYCD